MKESLGPSPFTSIELAERALHRRAVEAVIWGMPALNYNLMYQEMVRNTQGGFNQVLYWSRLLDWKNQTLTPNPDVIYLMPFINTKDIGPVVLEIPPADDGVFNGSIMNYWQAAIEDVGPGGVDKGKGGKYLILPPSYDKAKVPDGYIAMPSDTYQGYALLRSVLKSGSDADVAKAVTYSKRIKLYPLSQAANPPETKFVDASEAVFDSTIQYDVRFFELLNQMVQAEPWLERDKAMIDPLKTIGIERGKPFKPDAKTKQILSDAIQEAKAWFDARYDTLPPYYDGERWFFPITEEMHQNIMSFFQTPDSYPIDARGTAYTLAFFSAKHIGEAQYYLLTGSDKDGKPLDGKSSYRLNVPANAPVTQYWSMTVYNRDTHAFIRNAARVGRSSQSPGLQKNADGSADIFFGSKAPSGQESNWVPTDVNGRFEVLSRFYGPKKPLFDKTWKLPDIEKTP
ncbi:MAG: DUF1254 domain-containing protein [Candidatus Acidiferrales bacterium]